MVINYLKSNMQLFTQHFNTYIYRADPANGEHTAGISCESADCGLISVDSNCALERFFCQFNCKLNIVRKCRKLL